MTMRRALHCSMICRKRSQSRGKTGGRQWPVNLLTAVSSKGTQMIANDLSNQYVLTYVLPDGVKPSDRLSVEMKKKGVTLRAPTRISDK